MIAVLLLWNVALTALVAVLLIRMRAHEGMLNSTLRIIEAQQSALTMMRVTMKTIPTTKSPGRADDTWNTKLH